MTAESAQPRIYAPVSLDPFSRRGCGLHGDEARSLFFRQDLYFEANINNCSHDWVDVIWHSLTRSRQRCSDLTQSLHSAEFLPPPAN